MQIGLDHGHSFEFRTSQRISQTASSKASKHRSMMCVKRANSKKSGSRTIAVIHSTSAAIAALNSKVMEKRTLLVARSAA
ncbi:hypothetical protein [Massilia endophytica]|uniref:hypothetical protein n=1 Tax=Massilia endophytica TaxID=2899220 RepID=UPI001E3DA891|nr:hypothetical protein [Massilia endophytica]UGQ44775.1 hypothetical protein LSQ66_13285 [Massilia endophytica]